MFRVPCNLHEVNFPFSVFLIFQFILLYYMESSHSLLSKLLDGNVTVKLQYQHIILSTRDVVICALCSINSIFRSIITCFDGTDTIADSDTPVSDSR